MIFRQLTHDDLGCASYLIGAEHAGVAAVVDPKLDMEEYLRLARYLGARRPRASASCARSDSLAYSGSSHSTETARP